MPQLPAMSAAEQWNILLMTAATCLWFFAVGTAFGSFLNVVVYRMPRGLPVGGSSSHCPGCSRAIPWHDNVPILGYLRLRGRCQCRAKPISARYPIVETIVGMLVFALLMGELLSGGANLPLRQLDGRTGVIWVVWSLQWDLIGTFLYHATLLYVLLGLTLIDLDGFRPPLGWVGFGLIVGLAAPPLGPFLQAVPIAGVGDGSLADASSVEALTRSAVGAGVGILLGLILGRIRSGDERMPQAPAHQVAAFLLIGTYLGWQAAFSIALASALAAVVIRRAAQDEPALASLPASLPVWVLTLAQILLWRFLARYAPVWPGPFTVIPAWIGAAVALLAATFVARRFAPPPKPASEPEPPVYEPIPIRLPEPTEPRPGEPLG